MLSNLLRFDKRALKWEQKNSLHLLLSHLGMQLHSLNICIEKTSKILTEGELYEVLTNRSLEVAMGKKYTKASLQLKLKNHTPE